MPDPQDQNPAPNPAEPATPAEPAQPAEQPTPTEPATPASAEPAGDEGEQPTPDEGGGAQPAPQQTRQERRDQERASRGIGGLEAQVKQGQRPNQFPAGGQQSPQFPQYQPGQEVPADQLQRDVVQTASAIAEVQVSRQLAHRDAVNNFERDQETIPVKYDELNPDKPDFTPELDEAIAQEYQERAFKVVGYDNQGKPITQLDPSVRLSAIAERHVKAARAYAAKTAGNQRTATEAAADTTAPKPGGGKPADRKFEDLSLDEMRKKVGYHKV